MIRLHSPCSTTLRHPSTQASSHLQTKRPPKGLSFLAFSTSRSRSLARRQLVLSSQTREQAERYFPRKIGRLVAVSDRGRRAQCRCGQVLLFSSGGVSLSAPYRVRPSPSNRPKTQNQAHSSLTHVPTQKLRGRIRPSASGTAPATCRDPSNRPPNSAAPPPTPPPIPPSPSPPPPHTSPPSPILLLSYTSPRTTNP